MSHTRIPKYSSIIIKGTGLLDETRALLAHWDSSISSKDNFDRALKENFFAKASRKRTLQVLRILHRRYFTDPEADSWARSMGAKQADITVGQVVTRIFDLSARRCKGKSPVFIIDEIGQYVARSAEKIEDLRALVEQIGKESRNRVKIREIPAPVWVIVTSQEKLEDVVAAIDSKRVELAKLMDRFKYRIDLSPADIREVATKRVLAKKKEAVKALSDLYKSSEGLLNAACRLERTHISSTVAEDDFIQFYPYLPHFVELSIDIMSGIRIQPGATKHLGGSNRTIIKQAYEMLVSERTNMAGQAVGKLVTKARKTLEDALFEQLDGHFGIHREGTVEADSRMGHLGPDEKTYREELIAHRHHLEAIGVKPSEALAQLVREIAFTHFNRLCAYKMCEERRLIRESVTRGLNSRGFKLYLADHPDEEKLWKEGRQELAYRHFLLWLGGTLSSEIGILFSVDDPASHLFPPHHILEKLLELINQEPLSEIWKEDETIGWIYQYFTPKELRDQTRKESQAPRNSYELAFRNQFFTPRYVVEFLVDNTLGRIWYEMRKGGTGLRESCRYLVKRPKEVFLQKDEKAPEAEEKKKSFRRKSCSISRYIFSIGRKKIHGT